MDSTAQHFDTQSAAARQPLHAESACRSLRMDEGRYWAPFQGLQLTSHFQPIVSLSHRRVVGHEGLLRGHDWAGRSVPPLDILARAGTSNQVQMLDSLCHALHMVNRRVDDDGLRWLFLNLHPEVFATIRTNGTGATLQALMEHAELPPERIVIEVLEHAMSDRAEFIDAVGWLRELGCLIALDDFGAGHSNFDRVWRIKPDIVKLDRSFALQCISDDTARRMLPRIVGLLHEAGSLVVLEAVENEDQAVLAMDADIDFAQGYYFGRPQPQARVGDDVLAAIDRVWERFDGEVDAERRRYQARIGRYVETIGRAADLLAVGTPMKVAVRDFLALDGAERSFLLDEAGIQFGPNVIAARFDAARTGFAPLSEAHDAKWSRRPYFRRAIEHPGEVQVTRPYLSIASATLCVTVSVCFRRDGGRYVICGDIAW